MERKLESYRTPQWQRLTQRFVSVGVNGGAERRVEGGRKDEPRSAWTRELGREQIRVRESQVEELLEEGELPGFLASDVRLWGGKSWA